MNAKSISNEICPHRRPLPSTHGEDSARCLLLEAIVGPTHTHRCEVERAACNACLESFPPTTIDLNPVTASLLHKVTEEILHAEENTGVDLREFERLRDWAQRSIPLMFEDEEDFPPVVASAQPRDWVALEHIIPMPTTRSGARVSHWAVGVTTAPRRLPTLEFCLDALIAAGWDRPTLFIDEATRLPERYEGLDRCVRRPRVGAWPNYYLALMELTLRQPHADAYMILQDDAVLMQHHGIRAFLERLFWPGDEPGLVSLYCAGDYTQAEPGWTRLSRRWFWGALAFVFPSEIARRFLNDPEVREHRTHGPMDGLAGIDVLIGRFAERNQIPVYFPTPSLAQHIGQISSLWSTARASGMRRARRFAGDAQECPAEQTESATAAPPRVLFPSSTTGARFLRGRFQVVGHDTHRSGWPYAFAALQPLACENAGLLLDDFVEQSFCYDIREPSRQEPWVGIFHHPPNMPAFMKREHVPAGMFQSETWKRSHPHLRGAIALSQYLADYLSENLNVPTFVVKHPSEIPRLRWNPQRYARNSRKAILQVGWYLKNTQLIYQIPELTDHRKIRLLSQDKWVCQYDRKVARYWRHLASRRRFEPERVAEQCPVSAPAYDALLAENVVAIELFDSSANNVIVECIARDTPIAVNRHPAVLEYLTEAYPLYFRDPSELPALLTLDRIIAAHEFLTRLDKSWLNGASFQDSVRTFLASLERNG